MEVFKMVVTSTEFKTNLGKYLDAVKMEDIIIFRNGKRVAKLVSDDEDLEKIAKSLIGIIPHTDKSVKEFREERMRERYGIESND